ncbi:MAG: M16 family metallopeptidase [Planctomycetota bacterium]
MKKFALPIALCLLVCSTVASAADEGIHTRVLENGLRIVVKEDHSKPLAALRIYVHTGGIMEMEYLGCGISHYYEHLLSGGTTTTRTEAESSKILQELGGQNNAYTSNNLTCYFVTTHKDLIGKAIDLYGDWMMNNTLDPKEVEREKAVILKEINMGEDEPNRVIYKLFLETMFEKHPIRVPNIGYREVFEGVTRDDLARYYKNRYAPNNTVVAVAGDVDPEAVFALVEKAMGAWRRRPIPVVMLPEEPRQTTPRYAETEMDVKQPWARMGWHTIDLFHEDLYALDMVSAVLSAGRSSRLHRRVVEEEKLTDSILTYSWTPSFMTKGIFAAVFQAPSEKLERTIEVVKEEVAKIKATAPAPEELERAKVQVVADYQLRLQSVEDQAEQVGRDYLTTGDPCFSQRYVDRIQSVTPEEVVAAARRWLDPNGLTVAVLKPRSKAAEGAAATKKSAGKVEVHKEKLENGLTLIVKRTPGVKPVGIEVFAHGGLRGEPAGKNGISFLTGRLLVKGTKNRSAIDIARQCDEIGAAIGSQSGNNTVGLSLTLARGERDLPFAADLVADILGAPTFPAEEFAKEKQIAAMYASRQNEDWQTETTNFMRRELWPNHPYGNSRFGSPETVATITREDVLTFAKERLSPQGTVIGIAGDVDADAALARFRQALSALTNKEGYEVPVAPAPTWAGKSFAADRFAFLANEKKQATIAIAFPSCDYLSTDDRAALLVLDAFTSGIGLPSGWFHSALRGGEQSYVYFVHYSLMSFLNSGCAFVYTQTEPRLLKEVYGILLKQIERIRRGEFTDEELETGRIMALVSGPYHAQTVRDVAMEVALAELYGAGYDMPDRFQEALKKVTRQDVMRVIDRYMKHMLVVVTGPEEVRKILEEMSPGD